LGDGSSIGGGGSGGGDWKDPTPDNWFVMGFAGRYGEDIDQIQVVYGEFKPAKWTKS